jgi:hypothetical protein
MSSRCDENPGHRKSLRTGARSRTITYFQQKLGIREYVKSLGIPYTFIEVGWWMEFILPRPVSANDMWTGPSWRLYGNGDTPVALTDLDRIPDFVARIVQDERTLNKVVFASENETAQNEAWEYAAKSPEAAEILKKKNPVSYTVVKCHKMN